MEYDFRTRAGQSYDPNYSRPAAATVSSSAQSPYGKPSSIYPKIGGGGASSSTPGVPGRNQQFQHAPAPPSTSGIGIRVAVKPEYKITPPPPLSPHVGEIPRSCFHFDFEFERILLAEAVKENPNWSRLGLETVPPKPTEYAFFTSFTLTTAITDWSSVLYSVIYTALPTIVVGILDKDLSRATLLRHPQLYGTGQRQESYNGKLFWVMIMDTLWQSLAAFFAPLLAYWGSNIDGSSIGDIWIIAVVILVNLHLAMDVIHWYWITHVAIWGSIVATFICVMVIDALPFLPGYWAFFHIAGTTLFWACLLGITIAALVPRFVVKNFIQYFRPDDIQIAREAEKVENPRESRDAEIEMNPIHGDN